MPPKLRVGGPSPNDGPGVPPPNDSPSGEVVSKSAVNIDRRLKLTANGKGGSEGVPPPNDGPTGEVVSKAAVNIDRRLKLTANGKGGSTGVPSPNDGPDGVVVKTAVNIDRRLKLTVRSEGESAGNSEKGSSCGSADTPPHNAAPCCVGNLAASARRCVVAESSFAETDEATEQLSKRNKLSNKYLESLSPLEQRVCSIARDHLESSFDLSRSSGFVAWVGKK
jgi:hypothetical protein